MASEGAVVSIVSVNPEEALLILPAVSVALAVIVCEPALRLELVIDQLPSAAVVVPNTVVPSVSFKVTVEPLSAVPVKVGVVTLLISSVFEIPVSLLLLKSGVEGALGAKVSKLKEGVMPAPPVLPAVSV